MSRKVAEILLSLRVEQRLSKDELLEAYLNNVYWGHGVYGGALRYLFRFQLSFEPVCLQLSPVVAGCRRLSPVVPEPTRVIPRRNPKMLVLSKLKN